MSRYEYSKTQTLTLFTLELAQKSSDIQVDLPKDLHHDVPYVVPVDHRAASPLYTGLDRALPTWEQNTMKWYVWLLQKPQQPMSGWHTLLEKDMQAHQYLDADRVQAVPKQERCFLH